MFVKHITPKHFLVGFLCTGMFVSSMRAINRDVMRFGTFGAASIILALANNRISSNNLVKALAYYTNTDPKDLADCAMLSTLCWGSSYLSRNKTIRYFLRFTALINPLIQIAVTSKRLNTLIDKIPIINLLLSCRNPECDGICDQCRFTTLYKKAPLELVPLYMYSVAAIPLPPLRQPLRIERVDDHRPAAAVAPRAMGVPRREDAPAAAPAAVAPRDNDEESTAAREERRQRAQRAQERIMEEQRRNVAHFEAHAQEEEPEERELSPEELARKAQEVDSHLERTERYRTFLGEYNPDIDSPRKIFEEALARGECPICEEPVPTQKLVCANGHTACETCANKWTRNCPSCRGQLLRDEDLIRPEAMPASLGRSSAMPAAGRQPSEDDLYFARELNAALGRQPSEDARRPEDMPAFEEMFDTTIFRPPGGAERRLFRVRPEYLSRDEFFGDWLRGGNRDGRP